MASYVELQERFWRNQTQKIALERRLAYIESHFPGSYACGWEQDIFYPLPHEDTLILQRLWVETYMQVFGRAPHPHEGPGSLGALIKSAERR